MLTFPDGYPGRALVRVLVGEIIVSIPKLWLDLAKLTRSDEILRTEFGSR